MDEIKKSNSKKTFICLENCKFYLNGRWYLAGNEVVLQESEITDEIKKQIKLIKRK